MATQVKIVVEVMENQALARVDTDSCDDTLWHVNHEEAQVLKIAVSSEQEQLLDVSPEDEFKMGAYPPDIGEVGDIVGLVQTLVKSKRIATYEGGGRLTMLPDVDLPCLDGKISTSPWYDEECKGKPLPGVGEAAITFRLSDNPDVQAPPFGVDPANIQRPIESLKADEEFLITLWNHSRNKVVMQWTWGYMYEVVAVDKNNPQSGRLAAADEKQRDQLSTSIVLTGPGAGDSQGKGWTHGYDHPDPVWADQGEDPAELDEEEEQEEAPAENLPAEVEEEEEQDEAPAEDPPAEEVTNEEPNTDEPTDDTTTDQLTADEPSTEEPVAREPTNDEPEESVTEDELAAPEPRTEEPPVEDDAGNTEENAEE